MIRLLDIFGRTATGDDDVRESHNVDIEHLRVVLVQSDKIVETTHHTRDTIFPLHNRELRVRHLVNYGEVVLAAPAA